MPLSIPSFVEISTHQFYHQGRLFISGFTLFGGNRIYYSDNYGANWTRVDANLIPLDLGYKGPMFFEYEDTLFLTMSDTNDNFVLWKSGTRGDSWTEVNHTGFDMDLTGGIEGKLEINGDIYLGATTPSNAQPANTPRFYKSSDGGRTWSLQSYFGNNFYYNIEYQDPWGAIYEGVSVTNPSSGNMYMDYYFLSDTVSAWTPIDLGPMREIISSPSLIHLNEKLVVYSRTDYGNGPIRIYMEKSPSIGFEEHTFDGLSVSLFPQPVGQNLNLHFSEFIHGEMKILDVSGRTVNAMAVRGQNVVVELAELRSGVYFCELLIKDERKSIRFVKD